MSNAETTPATPAYVPPGSMELPDGTLVFRDPKGAYLPVAAIPVQDAIEDELVRKLLTEAAGLHEKIGAFRSGTMTAIGGFSDLLAQDYGARPGGPKGNMTLRTVDGLMEVRVQQADQIEFGPQLQIGKQLIDECMNEWAVGSREELKAVVTRAFNTDREGQINKASLFMLMRLKIEDERWQRAMDAIRDSIRVVGSKGYVRFYRRETPDGDWQAVVLDIAKA